MAFVPRSFTQILTDMIAYVQARTEFSDFTVGSAIRTILEAAALEDDEQYFQMVQLLDLFSYTTAVGEDLDRRLADFNIFREPAKAAFGKVRFFNKNLTFDQVASDTVSGSTVLQIFDSTGFPTSTPYSIRLAEDTPRVQTVVVTALDTATNTFTIQAPGLVRDVEIGDRVGLIDGTTPHAIAINTNISAPATTSEDERKYRTTELATIAQGDFYSNEVLVIATDAGEDGNVGAGRITQFDGSAPFNGAGVTNDVKIDGGTNRELDEAFRDRAIDKLQALSRGTVLSLRAESVGVEDPITGQRVVSSNVLEDFASDPDEVIVYVDDGTGLVPDITSLGLSSASGSNLSGDSDLTLADASNFPSAGFLLVLDDSSNRTLQEYESLVVDTVTLVGTLPANVTAGNEVRQVQVITTSAEEGQRRFFLNNPPVVRGTERIYVLEPAGSSFVQLAANTDYVLNKGTGEFVLVSTAGLSAGAQVVVYYSYYTNLIAEVQKVLEGDINDATNYPGVKAAGVFCTVEAPTIKRVSVRLTITAETTFVSSELAPLVETEVASYINSLKIGRDVIRSRIIDAAHNVQGVRSVSVSIPTSDIVVLENELPRAFDSAGESLITVL